MMMNLFEKIIYKLYKIKGIRFVKKAVEKVFQFADKKQIKENKNYEKFKSKNKIKKQNFIVTIC